MTRPVYRRPLGGVLKITRGQPHRRHLRRTGRSGYVSTINLGCADPAFTSGAVGVKAAGRWDLRGHGIGLYASGGEWWLGAQSLGVSEASMQPVLGPLTSDGVSFNFLDGTRHRHNRPGPGQEHPGHPQRSHRPGHRRRKQYQDRLRAGFAGQPGRASERAPMSAPLSQETGMRASPVANERGMALAVAIFALVVIGALVAAPSTPGGWSSRPARTASTRCRPRRLRGGGDAVRPAQDGSTLTSIAAGSYSTGSQVTARVATAQRSPAHQQRLAGERLGERKARHQESGRPERGQLYRLNQAPSSPSTPASPPSVRSRGRQFGSERLRRHAPKLAGGVSRRECPTSADVAGVRYNGSSPRRVAPHSAASPDQHQDHTLTASKHVRRNSTSTTLEGAGDEDHSPAT